jgi:trehalose 6-phosphate phosphatase
MEGLAAIVSGPDRALLAFDFDGVLSPIVDDPEKAQASPRAFHTLADVGKMVGSVAIVTGRPVSFLISRDRFGTLLSIPDFAVYGHYGREKWDSVSRTTVSAPPDEGIEEIRRELTQLLRRPGVHDGSWLEDKGIAVAIHTRRAADPALALATLSGPVEELAERHHLRVEPGKMVLEIRPPGVQKGDVLRAIVRDRGFQAILYAGDDLGDLSAFAAVDELRENGVPGIKVCSGSPEAPEVAEAADVVVDGPAGVADLLETLGQRIEHEGSAGATARTVLTGRLASRSGNRSPWIAEASQFRPGDLLELRDLRGGQVMPVPADPGAE